MIRWPAYVIIAGACVAISAAAQNEATAAKPGAATALQGDEEAGREAYAESCKACHSGAIAPVLKGVAGRAIATVPGYAYSNALKAKSGATWTPAELDRFLADPKAHTPGTKMMSKVVDAQKRADIIAYLQSLSQ